MNNNIMADFDQLFDEYNNEIMQQKETRSRKRKWREIETYKDKKWLKQELSDLPDYLL